jgi:hypothetical protein
MIENTSGALSRVIQVDICKASLAGHIAQPDRTPPTPTRSLNTALAIVQQGQAVGETLEDLIVLFHNISSYPEVERRIQNSSLQLAATSGWFDRNLALQLAMRKSLSRYNAFVHSDFVSVAIFAKYEYREAARLIVNMMDGAQTDGTGRCFFFENWFYNMPLIGRWLSRSFPETRLLGEVGKLNSVLLPQLGNLHRSSDRLLDDISALIARLNLAKDAGKDIEVLVADVEQHIEDLLRLGVILVAVRGQSTELGKEFLGLLKMINRHGCLGLSREDSKPVIRELAKVQASLDDVEYGWRQAHGPGK